MSEDVQALIAEARAARIVTHPENPLGTLHLRLADALESALAGTDAERAWCEGYYTGKHDYALSVASGDLISTPNPYSAVRGER